MLNKTVKLVINKQRLVWIIASVIMIFVLVLWILDFRLEWKTPLEISSFKAEVVSTMDEISSPLEVLEDFKKLRLPLEN